MSDRTPAGDKGTADRIEADDGGYWVRLVTWQALDREGACMRHCVGDGDYDDLVGGEDLVDDAIWSLRDRDGLSVLTVRIRHREMTDAKGYSNHPPGKGAAMQVRHLVAAFKAAGHPLEVSTCETEIVLLEDGRTFRHDRLPPEVQAQREAEASEAAEQAASQRERSFPARWGMRNARIEGGHLVVERNGETIQLAEVASHFAHTPEPVADGPVAGFAIDDGLVTIRLSEGRRIGVRATAVVRTSRSEVFVPFRGDGRLELLSAEGPLRPMVDRWEEVSPFSLTAGMPDPVFRVWSTFDTGCHTCVTRSGIRFTVPYDVFGREPQRTQDFLTRYHAAVGAAGQAPAAPTAAPQDPRIGLITNEIPDVAEGDVINLQDPEVGWVRNLRDVAIRDANGQPLAEGVDYRVNAGLGLVMMRAAHDRVTVDFRAGPQPSAHRIAFDEAFTTIPMSEAIEAAPYVDRASPYGTVITPEDVERVRAFGNLTARFSVRGPGGGGAAA